MSTETLQWLNTNTLIGYTDQRGHAWHYRASDQGDEPNHYPAAVPVDDVHRRLFHWTAAQRPVLVSLPASMDDATTMDDTGQPVRLVTVDGRQAITRSDTGAVLGIFADSYQPHQPGEWLVDTVATILGDELGIGSAGLLKGGAVAWVQVETPDTMSTPEGLDFRPNLLAATSFDGSLATTYARTATVVVCDNTLTAGLARADVKVRVKHTKYSHLRIEDARAALEIVERTAEDFAAEVGRLARWEVPTRSWSLFLDAVCPVDESAVTTRSATLAADKRASLERLYRYDARCAPWTGTALGVLQAVNTWGHHEKTVRGATRAERNQLNVVMGTTAAADAEALDILARYAPAGA